MVHVNVFATHICIMFKSSLKGNSGTVDSIYMYIVSCVLNYFPLTNFLVLFKDLVNKFNSLVLPEVSKCIVSNDPSLVEMLEMVGEIKLTMYPDLPLPEALRKLHEQLKQCALKNMPADLTATAAVDDLKSKLSSIMFATEEDRGQNIHV